MAVFNNTSFLCGYFSFDRKLDASAVLSSEGWTPNEYKVGIVSDYKQYYYPEFVEFSFAKDCDDGVVKHTLILDKAVSIGDISVNLVEAVICLMPYGMALYFIKVRMCSTNLNDFTLALFNMREIRRWMDKGLSQFCETAIAPIKKAAESLGYEGETIIENGNKLKLFQIITGENKEDFPSDVNNTLFELGTLGKIGGCSSGNPDSPSARYIEKVLDRNRLSYYNNWTGLALFDTFTIMGYDVSPWVRQTWESDYFSMIYIHSLFCKFYLFRLNARFRSNPELGKELENEYNEFERCSIFNKISYNFLPGEIDSAVDRALEISEEKKLIASHISGYNKMKANESSQRTDRILTFLALVTVFSTIWDTTSMINAMWPFENISHSIESGFRLVVSLISLAVLLVIILILRKPKM